MVYLSLSRNIVSVVPQIFDIAIQLFMTVLAKVNFFSSGHKLSGFSDKSLGIVKKVAQVEQGGAK